MATDPKGPFGTAILLAAASLAFFLAFSWWFLDGSTTRARTVRSRLTLVVETPEGERTGSSVSQQKYSFPGGLTKAQGYGLWRDFVGEAAVVDLGPRGLLFATLRSPDGYYTDAYNAGLAPFPREKFRGNPAAHPPTENELAVYLDEVNRIKPIGDLPFNRLPLLARFGDPTNPDTAELVDPNDLAASFGAGVTLKRAFVQITDDPLTKAIGDRLPWLKSNNLAIPMSTLVPANVRGRLRYPKNDVLLHHTDFRRLP